MEISMIDLAYELLPTTDSRINEFDELLAQQ